MANRLQEVNERLLEMGCEIEIEHNDRERVTTVLVVHENYKVMRRVTYLHLRMSQSVDDILADALEWTEQQVNRWLKEGEFID